MPLSASVMAGLMESNLMSFGANGSNLSKFCNAVSTGVVMSIVGKTFTTFDTGLVPGNGTGAGTGIINLSIFRIQSTALSLMSSQGVNATNLMHSIASAVATHLAFSADITSVDTPVYEGFGNIVVGSISVVASEMNNNIDAQLQLAGANGVNRTNLAHAIGTAIVTEILFVGTGSLAITGTPTGTPTPGTGSGTGVIA